MSKEYPECPLSNHADCLEIANPRICAIVREDKTCLIKLAKDEVGDKPLKAKQNPTGI
jgi:hypothetical protein